MSTAHPLRSRQRAIAAERPAALTGWPSLFVAGLLCSGVAVAALPPASAVRDAERAQWRALAIAPLGNGGMTGLRQMATKAVEPIDVAPERDRVSLSVTAPRGAPVASLLHNAGASYGDAVTAANLIASAAPALPDATRIDAELGTRTSSGRSIESLKLRAGFGLDLEIVRKPGGLELVRHAAAVDSRPLRVRGRVGDGLYWSLRAAGATPQTAAEYLQALAEEIDVGADIGPDDRFDMVIAVRRTARGEQQFGTLLYAGLDRAADRDLKLVKWSAQGRSSWIDADDIDQPQASAMQWPVVAPITSGFGLRLHPILRFARMHRGIDFGANWGSPIVAVADGEVVRAGWAGGYGRQVRIAHGGGVITSYSHMSSVAAEPGAFVRRGQVIGYVGSSGLSTGAHLHYEVYRGGVAVNPLAVRFAGLSAVDPRRAAAFKARLNALLSVGVNRG